MKLLSFLKNAIKKRLFYERIITVRGNQFRAPVLQGSTVYIQELWMGDVLTELFPYFPGAMLDIGVNLGQTLLTMRAIDRDRAYIGFEPNINCAAYVSDLLRRNDLCNSWIFPVAVFNRSAVLQLSFINDDNHDSSASVVDGFRPNNPVVESRAVLGLQVEDINGLFSEKTGLIKIDVEGAEHAVLQALLSVVKRDRPAIVLEILPAYTDENTHRLANNRSIEDFCKSVNYRITRIKGKGGKITFEPLDGIETHGNLDDCDYVLFPAEAALTAQ